MTFGPVLTAVLALLGSDRLEVRPAPVSELMEELAQAPTANLDREAALIALFRQAGAAEDEVELQPVPADPDRRLRGVRFELRRMGVGPVDQAAILKREAERYAQPGNNVIVRIAGQTDRLLVFGAHLDAARGSAGVVSNWTGCVALATQQMGIERPVHVHAADRMDTILAALHQTTDKDIVLLSGGVSVGNYDFVARALQRYGARVIFHKVTQKPGKPLLFARHGAQLLFGLPGNPLACFLCFHRYVAAAIRKMEGKIPTPDPCQGKLTQRVWPKPDRTHYVAAQAFRPASNEAWQVRPIPGISSADIFQGCQANCYIEVLPGSNSLDAGAWVRFTWIHPSHAVFIPNSGVQD